MNVEKSRARWDLTDDKAMAQSVKHARIPLCISDPNLPDNPIVFVNPAFLDLVGYAEEEVVGKNCRFLQGQKTTSESIDAVRLAIKEQRVDTVEIVNYRKDGTSFVNALQIGPILDDDGKLIFYFGSQLDVTEMRFAKDEARKLADEELRHRLGNIVNVMSSIIRMTAREQDDVKALATIIEGRLRALGDAHFETIARPDDRGVEFEVLAEKILFAYAPQGVEQFGLSGPSLALPNQVLSCVALCLHELATNSVKHGSFSAVNGRVTLSWEVRSSRGADRLKMSWSESGGPSVTTPERSSGSKIVRNLISAVGGSIEMKWKETGLVVDADFPL